MCGVVLSYPINTMCGCGGIGRRIRFRILRHSVCRFDPCHPHQSKKAPIRGPFVLVFRVQGLKVRWLLQRKTAVFSSRNGAFHFAKGEISCLPAPTRKGALRRPFLLVFRVQGLKVRWLLQRKTAVFSSRNGAFHFAKGEISCLPAPKQKGTPSGVPFCFCVIQPRPSPRPASYPRACPRSISSEQPYRWSARYRRASRSMRSARSPR